MEKSVVSPIRTEVKACDSEKRPELPIAEDILVSFRDRIALQSEEVLMLEASLLHF
jgi:hypothetical protein